MPTDDELAQTATAPASPSAPASAASAHEHPDVLGRFKLARELGAGGMGKVYEAHDPDLDRGVALKVLHTATSEDARTRLLKEARAMAKLSHPNVVTVFDVATHDGRDYIAMELIDGASLNQWLQTPHSEREIIAAFLTAGRGLAAAHAAGIVHRDFKPHNVLRRNDGRIAVTDFGIAHGSGTAPVTADITLERTATGTLMGTPAYMAPEQWNGDPVTPATDQFAFCVALWEALAGERPFGGESVAALRASLLAGPDKLDDSKLPRAVRPLLRRGLALEPTARWPSMNVLLDKLERTQRTSRRLLVGVLGVAAAASIAVAIVITRHHGPAVDPCGVPAADPQIIARQAKANGAIVVEGQLAAWHSERAHACSAPPAQRAAKLACLDGALVRLADAASSAGVHDADALANELVDPSACAHNPPPHLVSPIDPGLAAAFAALRSAQQGAPIELGLLLDKQEPCARAVALAASLTSYDWMQYDPSAMAKAMSQQPALRAAADQCNDDGIKALAFSRLVDAQDTDSVKRAEAALEALDTDENRASLDEVHGAVAFQAGNIDRALELYEQARARHHAAGRQREELEVINEIVHARLRRGRPDDLTAILDLYGRWATTAPLVSKHAAAKLLSGAAKARWRSGDVAAADAMAVSENPQIHAIEVQIKVAVPAVDVDGDVVDDKGQPVANAEVASGAILLGDSARFASRVLGSLASSTKTDEHGHFHLAEQRGFIVAGDGERRALPVMATRHVRLVLAPTSRLTGTVTVGDIQPGRLWVIAQANQVGPMLGAVAAPVKRDGTFELSGVPRGKIGVAVLPVDNFDVGGVKWTNVVVDRPEVGGITLDAASVEDLVVVARSPDLTPPEMAMVLVFHGRHAVTHTKLIDAGHKMGMFEMANATPASTVAAGQRGDANADDLVGYFARRPAGELTVCATGLAKKQLEAASTSEKMAELMGDSELACVPARADQTRVTLELPPMRRRP